MAGAGAHGSSECSADVGTRLAALRERIAAEPALVVAFSGGVDSALLCVVASDVLGASALAVTAVSPSLPAAERRAARLFARQHGVRHLEICTDEEDRPEYVANGSDRCFHCKSALFDALAPLADLLRARIALGTNLDDLGEHRPGLAASALHGGIAPLVDAGFGKNDVRAAAARLGLAIATKPAAACLASRVAYGEPVTREVLAAIEAAEDAVKALGFPVCRVRSHSSLDVARIEVPAEDIERATARRQDIDAAVRSAGFAFAAIDLAGFRSGRMNVLIGIPDPHLSTRRLA